MGFDTLLKLEKALIGLQTIFHAKLFDPCRKCGSIKQPMNYNSITNLPSEIVQSVVKNLHSVENETQFLFMMLNQYFSHFNINHSI